MLNALMSRNLGKYLYFSKRNNQNSQGKKKTKAYYKLQVSFIIIRKPFNLKRIYLLISVVEPKRHKHFGSMRLWMESNNEINGRLDILKIQKN